MDLKHIEDILEAVLLVAGEPLPVAQLSKLFDPPLEPDVVRNLLDRIRETWSGRNVELAQVATGWRFQAKPAIQPFLERLSPDKPPRYSRCRGVDPHRQDAGRPAMDRGGRPS